MRLDKRKLIYLFITIFVFSQFANGTGGMLHLQTYHNAPYDYSICYTADVFIPQGEADSGDGQRFLSKDGKAEMLVYGSNNALQQTLQQAFAEASASRAKDHPSRVVSYKAPRQD